MRKITVLLILFLLSGFLENHAQTSEYEIIGSDDYGRIFDVTYDENIKNRLYAITLGNHLLQSEDNGATWEILYALETGTIDGLKFLSGHNSLSFYSKNVTRTSLFVFNLQTGNISKEYELPYQQASEEWLEDYEIWENNPDIVAAIHGYKIGITPYQKVYYTENGGNDWSEIYHKENHDDVSINSVRISPDNSEKILMGRGAGSQGISGGLWISEDKGQTWTEKLPEVTFKPIAFHPENPEEIWIGSGSGSFDQEENLYKSTDGGETWEVIPLEWTDYIQDCINRIGINPYNPDHFVVLEENEIAISYDGGQNWTLFVYPGYDEIYEYSFGLNISFNPFDEEELWISANYFPMFSSDAGESLERQKTPFFVGEGNICFLNKEGEQHLYYGLQNGYIHRDLQTMEENEYDLLPLNYMTINIPTTLYPDKNQPGRVFTYSGGFMGKELKVSDDHGENRSLLVSGFAEQCTAVVPVPGNPDKIWAAFATLSSDIEIKEIDFSDLHNPEINSITPPRYQDDIFNIYFDRGNPERVLLSQGGSLYQSSDGGASWTEVSNGLELLDPDSDVIIKLTENPLNEDQLAIATSKGIFTTHDRGQQWERISDKPAHTVKFSDVQDGHIVAVVHNSDVSDFGIFFSSDHGQTWDEISREELLYVKTGHVLKASDIEFEEDKANIYVSSVGLGLIRFSVNLESLGIEDFEISTRKNLSVYPNPAVETISVPTANPLDSYQIFDINGKQVLSGTDPGYIDVTSLESGIYLIHTISQNNMGQSGKFIKK